MAQQVYQAGKREGVSLSVRIASDNNSLSVLVSPNTGRGPGRPATN
jgi:hypothetical protein